MAESASEASAVILSGSGFFPLDTDNSSNKHLTNSMGSIIYQKFFMKLYTIFSLNSKGLGKTPAKLSMPIIVLSNLGSRDDIDTAKSLGAMDFMIKANVAPAQIIDKVNEILSW